MRFITLEWGSIRKRNYSSLMLSIILAFCRWIVDPLSYFCIARSALVTRGIFSTIMTDEVGLFSIRVWKKNFRFQFWLAIWQTRLHWIIGYISTVCSIQTTRKTVVRFVNWVTELQTDLARWIIRLWFRNFGVHDVQGSDMMVGEPTVGCLPLAVSKLVYAWLEGMELFF